MTLKSSSVRISALAFAASASLLAQEAGAPAASADASSEKAPTSTAKSPVRFEGTDLHIGDLPPISFHGFASQGVIASSDYDYFGRSTDTTFQFNEFGLNASMSPFERTRIAAQAFLFDLGNVGNHDLMLDYAMIDYSFHESIGLRGGRVRRPFGLYNHIQDIDLARTFVLLPQSVYDARWRDFAASIDGGSVYGNINMGKGGDLSYEVYGGLINLSNEGGVARIIQNGLPPEPVGSFESVEGSTLVGGQLWWATPVPGLRAGAALVKSMGLETHYNVIPPFGPGAMGDEIDTLVQGYSLEYITGPWTFQAEYTNLKNDSTSFAGATELSTSESQSDGWYASAAYRFTSWFEAGTYYSEHYANVDDRDGSELAVSSDAFQKDLALALRFDPKPWWILKLEGHWIRGTSLLHDDNSNPVRNDDSWFMFAAKTTFSF